MKADGVAPDKPLDSAVLSRLNQFSAMNRLKKIAIRVSAHHLTLRFMISNKLSTSKTCSVECAAIKVILYEHKMHIMKMFP